MKKAELAATVCGQHRLQLIANGVGVPLSIQPPDRPESSGISCLGAVMELARFLL